MIILIEKFIVIEAYYAKPKIFHTEPRLSGKLE